MIKPRFSLFIILILIVILPRFSEAGLILETGKDYISGEIFYLSNHRGIGNLVVKLTPSRKVMGMMERHQREKFAKGLVTDQNGRFKFTGLPTSQYLLEVYHGPALLYRDIVDMRKGRHRTIILKGEEKKFVPNILLKVIPPEFKYE